MTDKPVEITGPNGEKGYCQPSAVAAWERNGWTVAPEAEAAPESAPAPEVQPVPEPAPEPAPHDDSTETLVADGPATNSEE